MPTTLIVGLFIVAVSALGIGFAMFGRRPPLQPATAAAVTHPDPVTTASQDRSPVATSSRRRRSSGGEPAGDVQRPCLQVSVPAAVRIRSAFLLGLGVIAAAAAIGVLLSVVVVGFFTLIG